MDKKDIKSLTLQELTQELKEMGMASFRGKDVYKRQRFSRHYFRKQSAGSNAG